jgi:hypothetical protein
LKNLSRKFKFDYNRTRIKGTLHDSQYTFLVVPLLVLFIIKNVSDKVVEKFETPVLYSMTFFFENPTVCEIIWKKICRAGLVTDDRMAHAHCMLDD